MDMGSSRQKVIGRAFGISSHERAPVPICPLCGRQITSLAYAEPYGKKGKTFRHSRCKPTVPQAPTLAPPSVLEAIKKSPRKGRDAWRKRHRWVLNFI